MKFMLVFGKLWRNSQNDIGNVQQVLEKVKEEKKKLDFRDRIYYDIIS